MSFVQEKHTQARTVQIENIFQKNREAIKADLIDLELSMRDIAAKYKVNDRNVRRWGERLGIDCNKRTIERRQAGFDKPKCMPKKAKQEDAVRNPTLLSMRW